MGDGVDENGDEGRGDVLEGAVEVLGVVGRGAIGGAVVGRWKDGAGAAGLGGATGLGGAAIVGVVVVVVVAGAFAFLATLRFATFFAGLRADAFFAVLRVVRFFAADFAVFFFLREATALVLLVFLAFFAFFAMIVLPIVKDNSLDSTITVGVNSKMHRSVRCNQQSNSCI